MLSVTRDAAGLAPRPGRLVLRIAGRAALVVGGAIVTLAGLQGAAHAADPSGLATGSPVTDSHATGPIAPASSPAAAATRHQLLGGGLGSVVGSTVQSTVGTTVGTLHPTAQGVGATVDRTVRQTADTVSTMTHAVPHVDRVADTVGKLAPDLTTQVPSGAASGITSGVTKTTRDLGIAVTTTTSAVVTPVVHQVVAPVVTQVVDPVVSGAVAPTVRTTTRAAADLADGIIRTTGTGLQQATHPETGDQPAAPSADTGGTTQTSDASVAVPVPVAPATTTDGSEQTALAKAPHSPQAHHWAQQDAARAFAIPVIPAALELDHSTPAAGPDSSTTQGHGATRVRVPPARAPALLQTPGGSHVDPFAGLVMAAAGERDRPTISPLVRGTTERLSVAAVYAVPGLFGRDTRPSGATPPDPGNFPD